MELKVFITESTPAQGLTQTRASLARFGGSIKNLMGAVFTLGAVSAGIRGILRGADSVDETALRLGISTDAWQEWTFAARMNGTSLEQMQSFIERLSAAAADPSKSAAWAKLGVNPNQTPEDLFRSVQHRTAGKSPTEIMALLSGLIEFRQIGPMVNLLAGDLDSTSERARKLGAVMDSATVKQLSALCDQLDIVSQVLMGNFAPALLTASEFAIKAYHVGIRGPWVWWKNRMPHLKFSDLFRGPVTPLILWERYKEGDAAAADAALRRQLETMHEALQRIRKFTPVTPGAIQPMTELQEGPRKALSGNPATDGLVRVGNFLGASRSALASILAERNQLLREKTGYLRRIARA